MKKILLKLSSNRAEQFLDFGSLEYHTIQKVKFLSKNSILTKPQHVHEFFTQIFLTIFLVKSKLSTAKKYKTTTFLRVFHPKKNRKFKLNFWTKNEDFEQCDVNSTYIPTWMVLVFGLVLVA